MMAYVRIMLGTLAGAATQQTVAPQTNILVLIILGGLIAYLIGKEE